MSFDTCPEDHRMAFLPSSFSSSSVSSDQQSKCNDENFSSSSHEVSSRYISNRKSCKDTFSVRERKRQRIQGQNEIEIEADVFLSSESDVDEDTTGIEELEIKENILENDTNDLAQPSGILKKSN